MAERFDPYYTWLGIPPEEQPANHYRLLGLNLFEAKADVISNAADQRMAHLKTLQGGKRAADSQRLLNELSAAVACLLNPEKKQAYDQWLQSQQPQQPVPVAVPLAAAISVAPAAPVSPAISISTHRPLAKRRSSFLPVVVGFGSVVLLGAVAFGLWRMNQPAPPWAEVPSAGPPAAPSGNQHATQSSGSPQAADTPVNSAEPGVAGDGLPVPDSNPPVPETKNEAVSSPPPAEAAGTPAAPTTTDTPPAPSLRQIGGFEVSVGEPVNLMKVERHLLTGRWRWTSAKYVTSAEGNCALEFKHAPPADYLFEAKITRLKNRDHIAVGILVEGHPCSVVIDGFTPPASGLENVDGQRADANPTTFQGQMLQDNQPAQLRIAVIGKRVIAELEGKILFDWNGDSSRLSPHYQFGDGKFLGIRTWKASYQIEHPTLYPILQANLPPGSLVARPDSPPATVMTEDQPPRTLADLVNQPASAQNATALDMPPAEALEKARAQVVEVLGAEAKQATKSEQKAALGRKMLGLARETKDDAAAKYVLLDNARKLFIGAGEVSQAMQTAAAMSQQFKLAADELNHSTFDLLADANLMPEARDRLAAELMKSLDAALDEQKLDVADAYSLLAVKVASRSKDVELRKSVAQRRSDVQRLKAQAKEVEEARMLLAADANNPAANLTVGKFLCFVLGDWEQGRTHLLKSGQAEYVAAAEADVRAARREPDAALAAADAWFALAESLKKDDREASAGALGRAKGYYRTAVATLNGLDKVRIEKRLAEMEAAATTPARPDRRRYRPGLLGREYAKHESQADNNLYTGWVPPEDLGNPLGPPVLLGSLAPLKYSSGRNAVARGYLKIDTAGEYAFNADADYDRVALYVNNELICPFRDGEREIARIKLEKGMVPIQVVSMATTRKSQCIIQWQPPGTPSLAPIPPTVMFNAGE